MKISIWHLYSSIWEWYLFQCNNFGGSYSNATLFFFFGKFDGTYSSATPCVYIYIYIYNRGVGVGGSSFSFSLSPVSPLLSLSLSLSLYLSLSPSSPGRVTGIAVWAGKQTAGGHSETFSLGSEKIWKRRYFQFFLGIRDGAGTEPEPGTGTVGTVFPGAEIRTGTVGKVFRNRNRNRAIPLNCAEMHRKPLFQRNHRNRKP